MYALTRRIILASSSADWEPYMKATPPSLARASPIFSPETACMMALTIGILSDIEGSLPFLNRTSGVLSDTFAGMHSDEE